MFKLFKITLFLIIFQSTEGQKIGIEFEKDAAWDCVIAKAKVEHKYIFVDCYTTWCGPCKVMEDSIYPLKSVGTFYNQNFINAKFQFDSTGNDSPEIQARYRDVSFLRKKYDIKGYPTYLFFSEDGELVHQDIGASNEQEFIEKGKNALNPETQFFTQLKKYNSGYREPDFLKKLALLSLRALNAPQTSKIARDYISSLKNLDNPDDLYFINETTLSVEDTGFIVMTNHFNDFEAVLGKEKVRRHLEGLITESELQINDYFEDWGEKEWDSYYSLLSEEYPLFANNVFFTLKTIAYERSSNWAGYAKTIDNYLLKNSLASEKLNDYAWNIFQNCSDKNILKAALQWSKASFSDQTPIDPNYMDTYAHLLYKLGKNKAAILWEKKARKIAIENGLGSDGGQDLIDKINRKEKTW